MEFTKEELENEIWKDILGYEAYYQVSDMGRVKSLSRKLYNGKVIFISKEKILNTSINDGYKKVCLYKDCVKKHYTVHMLIAIAYLNHTPDRTTKIVVDHIDNKRDNNKHSNLQLISHRENITKECMLKSRIPGVYWCKTHKKWRSEININNSKIFIGRFNDKNKAVLGYKLALDHIGMFLGSTRCFRELILNKIQQTCLT